MTSRSTEGSALVQGKCAAALVYPSGTPPRQFRLNDSVRRHSRQSWPPTYLAQTPGLIGRFSVPGGYGIARPRLFIRFRSQSPFSDASGRAESNIASENRPPRFFELSNWGEKIEPKFLS